MACSLYLRFGNTILSNASWYNSILFENALFLASVIASWSSITRSVYWIRNLFFASTHPAKIVHNALCAPIYITSWNNLSPNNLFVSLWITWVFKCPYAFSTSSNESKFFSRYCTSMYSAAEHGNVPWRYIIRTCSFKCCTISSL